MGGGICYIDEFKQVSVNQVVVHGNSVLTVNRRVPTGSRISSAHVRIVFCSFTVIDSKGAASK